MRTGFGIERQCKGCEMPKITIAVTGLKENLGQHDGIKELYWGPSRQESVSQSVGQVARQSGSQSISQSVSQPVSRSVSPKVHCKS